MSFTTNDYERRKRAILAAHGLSIADWIVLDRVRLMIPLPPRELARFTVKEMERLLASPFSSEDYERAIENGLKRGHLRILSEADIAGPRPHFSTYSEAEFPRRAGSLDFTMQGRSVVQEVLDLPPPTINHFELFALGESFDVDAYLASTVLTFDRIWHRGERHYVSSGVAKELGDGPSIPIPEQQLISAEFLSTYRDPLRALAQYPGVETLVLGLHYQIKFNDRMRGFCMGPSASLMWHALDVGIEPMFYVVLDREAERTANRTARRVPFPDEG